MTKSLYNPEVERKGEVKGEAKGIRESIITILTTKFPDVSNIVIQKIKSENNINVLKDFLVKIISINSLSDIEKVITRKNDNI